MSIKGGRFRRKKRIPKWCLDHKFHFDRHDVDDYSCWTDRSVPTPELDTDPRMAEDALDADKPRGMGGSNTSSINNDLIVKAESTKEMEDYFEERTSRHIGSVQDNVAKIVERFPEYKEVVEVAKGHDASKLQEPERSPYVKITWRHKLDDFKSYKTPGALPDPDENEATLHHIKNNTHHPESWLKDKDDANLDPDDRDKSKKCIDALNMSDNAIVEMVADWQAMSEELKKNTAREWYNKQKDVRWHFSGQQDKLIDKLLKVFE